MSAPASTATTASAGQGKDKAKTERKLRIAVIGVGRQGRVHADNLANTTSRAELVAVVDPSDLALRWAEANLPSSVRRFHSPEEMYGAFRVSAGAGAGADEKLGKGVKGQSGPGLDAVAIASDTDSHAPLAVQAIGMGLHVLEKPISTKLERHVSVIRAAAKRPDLKVLIALSRRFDPSYRTAHQRVISGALGDVYLIRSATVDQYDSSGWFVPYSAKSGGIWADCGIHDIDLARWFLGLSDAPGARSRNAAASPPTKVQRAFATGYNARHPELAEFHDSDNTLGIVQLSDGRAFNVHLGRTAIHGHECVCEIHGTEGRVAVNQNPRLDRIEILDGAGVRSESTPTYFERFRDAFVAEAREFVAACLDDTPLPVTLNDAFEAAKVAEGLRLSLRLCVPIDFDEQNFPIEPSSANTKIDSRSTPAVAKL